MYKVLVAPFSKPIPVENGWGASPKDYPWWTDLISILNQTGLYEFHQLSIREQPRIAGMAQYHDNLPYGKIVELINDCDFFISIDTFLPHIAQLYKKRGFVIWGMGHPRFFGYMQNINILKDEKYVRPNDHTWGVWIDVKPQLECWHTPDIIANIINDNAKQIME